MNMKYTTFLDTQIQDVNMVGPVITPANRVLVIKVSQVSLYTKLRYYPSTISHTHSQVYKIICLLTGVGAILCAIIVEY